MLRLKEINFLKSYRLLSAILGISFISGCVSTPDAPRSLDMNSSYRLNPVWAQSALKKERHEFRKVNRMSPVIYKNTIIVGNAHDGLVSFDLESKKVLWRREIPLGVEASAASINYLLFVGGNNGVMYSVDMRTGEVVWQFDSKSELLAEPLLSEGVLYFLSGGQSLYALEASSGKQLWIYNRQDTSSNMTIRGGSRPAISGGLVYSGFSDGSLVALNIKNGEQAWEINLNKNSKFRDIDASPVIDSDYVYVNSYDDKLYCVSKDKGQVIWSEKSGGYSNPIIKGEQILFGSSQGELISLNKKNGKKLWGKNSDRGVFTEVEFYNGMLLLGESQGHLLLLKESTGETLASFEPGRGVFTKPTVFKNHAYFVSGEGNIYGVQIQNSKNNEVYYLR